MNTQLFEVVNPDKILIVFIFFFSFLLGSIPFGLFIARVFKVQNLKGQGSGNIGASNVSRVIGFWPAGLITFVLDVGKGMVAVTLASAIGRKFLAMLLLGNLEIETMEISVEWAAGFIVVVGHCFSPWLHFKGGKGVATGLGAFLVLSPLSAMLGLVGFLLTFSHKKIASLSSIAGLLLAAVSYLIFNPVGVHLGWGAAMLFLILIRHESNIDALLENRESNF